MTWSYLQFSHKAFLNFPLKMFKRGDYDMLTSLELHEQRALVCPTPHTLS